MTQPTPNATREAVGGVKPCVHFVGFRGDEYHWARQVFGEPDFIHMTNDPRMRREVHQLDTIIYANGADSRPASRNSNDIHEDIQP